VLTPRVATVTSIGLDHTGLLGDTLEAIAREKAGIFKRGIPAVIGEETAAIRALLKDCAMEAGAHLIVAIDDEYEISEVAVAADGTSYKLRFAGESRQVTTPLIGGYQTRNTTAAIATIAALGPDYLPPDGEISKALANVFLPGRFQRRGKIIFDVAHNPAGARTIAETVRELNPPEPRTALVAVLADKDWRGIIGELSTVVDRFLFTNAPSAPADRRWDPAVALRYADSEGLNADLEPDLDVALARGEGQSETLIVTGSFHTVGDAMSRLQVSPFAA
jgi:dihydrofolate synthase/folylpolyglutamate synthase